MPTILVDGNNVGIASFFVNAELRDPMNRPSGAIYGFIRSLRKILQSAHDEFGSDEKVNVLVAWDGGNCWREELLPSYKASRSDPTKKQTSAVDIADYHEQVPRLRDILQILGVHQLRAHGYEADDIAGSMVNRAEKGGHKVILVTNDKDWFQLVSPNVRVWRPLKESFVDHENFEAETGCKNTDEYVRAKAIMGDKGDDVPGAVGIGPGFALKYLRGELTKGKKFDTINAWMSDPEGYERTLKLVDLREMHIPALSWQINDGKFNQNAILENFIQLSFESILSGVSSWLQPFKRMHAESQAK